MRKRLFIGAVTAVGLLAILILSAYVYVRSGRLDLYLQARITESLADVGIRADIDRAHLDLKPYKVILTGVRLYAGPAREPFASADEIEGDFSVLDYLRQQVRIDRVRVVHPRLKLHFDQQGKSQLDLLHAPPERNAGGNDNVSLLKAACAVDGAAIDITDDRDNLSALLPWLSATFVPNSPNSNRNILDHTLDARATGASVVAAGRRIENIGLALSARVGENSAAISSLSLSSGPGTATLSGQIDSYSPFKYSFAAETTVALDRLAYLIDPGLRLTGSARFNGNVTGTALDYQVKGALGSPGLSAEGFRIDGVRVAADLSGHGSGLKGVAEIKSSSASGPDASVGPAGANLRVDADTNRFGIAGSLALDSVDSGQIRLSAIKGDISAGSGKLELAGLQASALGGLVTGKLVLGLGAGQSSADLAFKSIDLGQAAALAGTSAVAVGGTADGTAQLSFPGFQVRRAAGNLNLNFDAKLMQSSAGPVAAPATGEIALAINGAAVSIKRAAVHSAASDATATGTIDANGGIALDLSFDSSDMGEVQRAVDALGLIPDDFKSQYPIQLEGPGDFKGHLSGTLREPSVDGRVTFSGLKSNDQEIGSLEGNIAFSPSLMKVSQGRLSRPDGSHALFSADIPLPIDDNVSVSAELDSFDLPVLAQTAAPDLAGFVGRGVLTGKIDLTGLPGPRSIKGSGDISLTGAQFNVPSTEGEDQTRKIDVPLLTGKARVDSSNLTIDNLETEIGDSAVSGQFSFNFDTYAYQINALGKNVDLGQLADAFSDNLKMSGRAEVSVKGQGAWDDWSTTSLTGSIKGSDVALNGRHLGDATIAAQTTNGLLNIQATAAVLDKPGTMDATINLLDRENYPVHAEVSFSDTDIGPYLGLLSPDLASVTGKATGSITLAGPTANPDQVAVVARLSRLEVGGTLPEGRRYVLSNRGDVIVTATLSEVALNRVSLVGEGTSLTLGGAISRDDPAKSALDIDGEINLRLISSFTDILYTSGIASIHARVGGVLAASTLTGAADLRGVGVNILDFPLSMSQGRGRVIFTADQAAIQTFTAAAPGGGRLTITGGAALSGLLPERWRLDAAAEQVQAEYPRDTQTVFDGNMALQGDRHLQVLSGDLRVRRASYTKEVTLSDLVGASGPFSHQFIETGPGGGGGPGPKINLDVKVDAEDALVMRNNLVDARGGAHIYLRGPIEQPIASGAVSLDRGTIQFRNDRYEIVRGLITFPGKGASEPILDLQTEAVISGYRVSISFNGPPSRLHVTPRSDPQLPENDLIALILTGRPTGDTLTGESLTTYSTNQTGAGLAQSLLSATLSTELQRRTERIFGLNRFSIDPLIAGRGTDPTARVTLGQRITKDLTATYSQNLTSGTTGLDRLALVEYTLSNRLSIVGVRDELGNVGFEIRIRKRF